jgi:hypothetical protein
MVLYTKYRLNNYKRPLHEMYMVAKVIHTTGILISTNMKYCKKQVL